MKTLLDAFRTTAITFALIAGTGCTSGAAMEAASVADAARGRQLYETTCIACHTTQAHWREKSIVRNWDQLVGQVQRWQRNAGQNWSRGEIEDVAAYLNGQFYRLECTRPGCSGPRG